MKTKISKGLRAIRMTAEQVKQDNAREYNPSTWEANVDRYSKYKDVQFYKVEKGNGYDYSRFFVVYTLDEGVRLMNTFSYSSSITNGGFYRALISDCEVYKDDNNELEVVVLTDDNVLISTEKLFCKDADGKMQETALNTSIEARYYMTEQSKKYGSVWTKCYLG
jgi:hypothetical protein